MKTWKLLFLLFTISTNLYGTGEPSTYFNIFVPPNNDAVQRNVCLIVTAIYDSTTFTIVDDDMDGDNDDSKSGMLMAGQSYILYIKDNGINDDAKYASGGVLKQDGDYFIIHANKIILASQSTDSDWQHDWVPSVNKSSKGTKFIIYSPKTSNSNRDVNVMPYEANTHVTIRKISFVPTLTSGTTNVKMDAVNIVAQETLQPGEDIIYKFSSGRNLLISGETYVVESDKPITVQYGALYGNERDGGGYVPSNNGSSSGDLFYFAVPYQAVGEQEIRIISWDNSNQIKLERYSNGSWISMNTRTVNRMQGLDWVGKNNGNVSYPTIFRVTCTAGKKVSVFEANWLETGNPGTSDIATMVSSENGTTSGSNFLVYMAPPGNEHNVRNPFTGTLFGQQLTHVYLFAKDTANVTVRDASTGGTKINRSYKILPGRYVDCYLTLAEWKLIYNNSTTSTTERPCPYLEILSDNPISVMNTNFNDNWMMYFGSSQEHYVKQTSNSTGSLLAPGQTSVVTSTIEVIGSVSAEDPTITVLVGGGLEVLSSNMTNTSTGNSTQGEIVQQTRNTLVVFDSLTAINPGEVYSISTNVMAKPLDVAGNIVPNLSIQNVETVMSATYESSLDMSVSSVGISNETALMSKYIFEKYPSNTFSNQVSNSWSVSFCDYNKDGNEDLFFTEYSKNANPLLYKNNGNGTFSAISNGTITSTKFTQTSASWVDMDRDGDQDAFITGIGGNKLFRNDNGVLVLIQSGKLTNEGGYFHGACWADFDHDGWIDVFLSNYMPTKFNTLYRNIGNMNFQKVESTNFPMEAGMSIGATWIDIDNDGYADLFVPFGIPNNGNINNSLFHNEGNGTFKKVQNNTIGNDGGNSTGSCWGDIDNDGDQDLFVSNASNQNNFIYINDGKGNFQRRITGIETNDKGHSHGCNFSDFDNDGDLDLYVSNDQGRKYLYINDGNGNFTKNTDELVTGLLGKTISNAVGDYDKDGQLDIVCATHSNQINYLFHNTGNTNSWLSIRLEGLSSNKEGIGSEIKIVVGSKTMVRQHYTQSGFAGQNSSRVHFGLGTASIIDSVMVAWPSGIHQILTNIKVNQTIIISEPARNVISGSVYYDKNQNCKKDQKESYLSGIRLALSSGMQRTATDKNGFFSIPIDSGVYSISLNESYWNFSCPDTTFIVASGQSIERSIPVYSTINKPDLGISITALAKRRGFISQTIVSIKNEGSEPIEMATVDITFPSDIFPTTAQPMFSNTLSSNTYRWMLSSIGAGEGTAIVIFDSTGLSTAIGDDFIYTAEIATPTSEWSLTNNFSEFKGKVVGAIDPNDMLVFPTENGYISAKDTIHYLIRFQNVGTCSATRVTIIDELPDYLDANSFDFIKSSHACATALNGRNVTFTFPSIDLPDSTTNEPKSHGFLEFSIVPVKEIFGGAIISNFAKIGFDYEEYISTNKVETIVRKITEDGNLIAYPNPADLSTKITIDESRKTEKEVIVLKTLEIRDVLNHLIQRYEINDSSMQLQTKELSGGLYYIIAYDYNNTKYKTKLMVVQK